MTHPATEIPTTFDLTQTDGLLRTTKAVSRRLDLTRDVPTELILDCIRIASAAPIGGNREANRWLVVKDPVKRQQLAQLYQEVGNPYLAALRAKAEPGSRQARVIEAGQYIADHLAEVPALVLPIRLGVVGEGVFNAQSLYGSVVPAVWSFQLAARSRGLGTRYTTYLATRAREVAELLGIPEEVTQVALLPVAYYTGERFSPAPRRDPAEITYLDSWENPVG
ncbi:nitroreductase family protein [Nocardioides sp. LHD-245]|uniref:nitroreductase family protein n=1 Tax=Nocardioides sp. LHD-245 TaxID=3051387 RepID=UPI0027DFD8B5|nr:nitroreductase family protein [Nocardioides sp. LHD-245]